MPHSRADESSFLFAELDDNAHRLVLWLHVDAERSVQHFIEMEIVRDVKSIAESVHLDESLDGKHAEVLTPIVGNRGGLSVTEQRAYDVQALAVQEHRVRR